MATIRKRQTLKGHVRYQAQVRKSGHPHKSATFKRKSDAIEWAAGVETLIIHAKYFPKRKLRPHTVHDTIERYLREVMPEKRESTRESQQLLLSWWDRDIGQRNLNDVTPALLSERRQKFLATPGRNGGQRSPAIANRYMATLSHVFTVAIREWEWTDENPCQRIKKLREPRGRTRHLSKEERMRLLRACKENGNRCLYAIVVVALMTGMRRGEILSLCWRDVDFKNARVVVRESKNGETRTIPLVGSGYELICDLRKLPKDKSDLVFPVPPGQAFSRHRLDIRRAWDKATRAAGIEDFRFHDLRHTFASDLAEKGANLTTISALLGHKTLQMVKRYTHLREEHGRLELEKLVSNVVVS